MRYTISLLTLAGLLAFAASTAWAGVNTQAISSARSVDQAQAAYDQAAQAVVTPADELTLNKAYVHTMARLGQPKVAYDQAQLVIKADPADSTAWAVVAYVQADAGQTMPALEAITHVRPDSGRFATRTVGQLLALFDTRVDSRDTDPGLLDSLTALRHDFRNDSVFTDAYNQAADTYGAQAQTPPPDQAPGEAYQGEGDNQGTDYVGETNTVEQPFNNDYFGNEYYPAQSMVNYDLGGYGNWPWWGGGVIVSGGDGDFDRDDFHHHHHWANSSSARSSPADRMPQVVQDQFTGRRAERQGSTASTGFTMTNAPVSQVGAGSITPDFASGNIQPNFASGNILPNFTNAAGGATTPMGVTRTTFAPVGGTGMVSSASVSAWARGQATIQNSGAVRSRSLRNRDAGTSSGGSGNDVIRARAVRASSVSGTTGGGSGVVSVPAFRTVPADTSASRVITVSPPATVHFSNSAYMRGNSFSRSGGRNYYTGYSAPMRTSAAPSGGYYQSPGGSYRGAVSTPGASTINAQPSFSRHGSGRGGRR